MKTAVFLAAVLALGALAGCQGGGTVRANALLPDLPAGWRVEVLPGAQSGVDLVVLKRPALVAPARYRVVVLPGSGCTGWLPLAKPYFSGLLHAELLVLHKPQADISAMAGTACKPGFIQTDALSAWRDHARAALRADQRRQPTLSALPQLLLGISEGAELLPELAPEMAALAGVVMLAAPGLDPRETAELQVRRLGQWPAWQRVEWARSSDAGDGVIVQGRTLRYWRDFWNWPLAEPLRLASWPLLRVWGDADELVPLAAYQQFATLARQRTAPFCDLRLPGADHGLQTGSRDGVQWLWARLEIWARTPEKGFCEAVMP